MAYLLYKIGEWLCKVLGRRGSYWLACRFADVRMLQSVTNRRVIHNNLSVVLQGRPHGSVGRMTREAFHHSGKTLADFLRMRRLVAPIR